MLIDRQRNLALGLLVAALSLTAAGCGAGGPTTYRVNGRVDLAGGDLAVLAGHYVEAALISDPTVRAAGIIEPDGCFTLETLQGGALRSGAVEGNFRARLVLSDDDPAAAQRAGRAVAARFLAFETSGLTFEVPATGNLVLTVTAR